MNQRDQGCCYPGCERPPGWCEAHHVTEWARGGKTSLSNLILLCARHHRTIHDAEHTITIEPGQRPVITKPRWPAAA
ncbi:MAG: HNH endonuclease signature motif containing protein [Actinomycetes bacterium]